MKNMRKVSLFVLPLLLAFTIVGSSSVFAQSSAPDPIHDLIAISGDGEVNLVWSAPFNNGQTITSYKITSWETGSDVTTSYPNLSINTSATVTGLKNNVSYSFKVYAVNSAGTSPDSNIAAATPIKSATHKDVPNAVTDLKTTRGDSKVTLSWSTPNNNGFPLVSYTITYWKIGTDTFNKKTVGASATTGQVTGLQNDVSYSFKINALNEVGMAPDSNISSATPSADATPSVPNQVRGVVAIPSKGQALVSWLEPSDNGSPIVSYKVIVSEKDATNFTTFPNTSDVTKVTISGLKNGVTYDFKVIAVNGVGESKASKTVSATPTNRVPAAVSNLKAVAGHGAVTLSWSVSSEDLESITGFRIREYQTGASSFVTHEVVGKRTSATINGLTNGVSYGFRVVAVSPEGIGPDSKLVQAMPKQSPSKGPGAITDLTATAGDAQITLSWKAPFDNNSPITGYNIIQSKTGSTSFTTIPKTGTTTNTIITGLVNGEQYSFKVSAKSADGTGPESKSVSATPVGAQSTLSLPPWIKNSAKWWSEGLISDLEYVQSIEYLINKGIIKVK